MLPHYPYRCDAIVVRGAAGEVEPSARAPVATTLTKDFSLRTPRRAIAKPGKTALA
jgi:hypothetical protein